MDSEKFIHQYWNHYIILEEDLIKTFRYVFLDERNYQTFSFEYQRLLLAIGSELDVIFKLFCDFPGSASKNINDYKTKIKQDGLMELDNKVIINKKFGNIELKPFGSGLKHEVPKWWTAYNKVKHNRTEYVKEANLENVLFALSGLYLLEEYCYKKFRSLDEIDYLDPESKLFNLNWERTFSPAKNMVVEHLPDTFVAPQLDFGK